jgi:signal transduction histidine kinase
MQEASVLESERLSAVKLLAAGVAHEIGNPLNALNIHLQLLERNVARLPEDQSAPLGELVSVARKEVTRLDLIITQFLRAVRPVHPEKVLSRIDELLKEALSLLKQEIRDRKIEVEIECPESIPKINVDPNQIKQAFFNVIRNAFQAMPDGGRLRISLSSSDRYVGTSFQDTGVGIKPEDFGRIFEPYHTTKVDGSGLGLMIVQRIIQDHGGQIEVASKPGQGTAFTILLPVAERRIRLLRRAGAGTGQGAEDEGAVSKGRTALTGLTTNAAVSQEPRS